MLMIYILVCTLVIIWIIWWLLKSYDDNKIDNTELYSLIKDNENKIIVSNINTSCFTFYIDDTFFELSTWRWDYDNYIKIWDKFKKYLSPNDYNKIYSIIYKINYNSIRKKIWGFKLDDDIQKAIDDTARIQEAHAQIGFLTNQVQLIKSSYVNRGKE